MNDENKTNLFIQIFMVLVVVNLIILVITWISLFSMDSPENLKGTETEVPDYKANIEKELDEVSQKMPAINKTIENLRKFSEISDLRDMFSTQVSVSFKLIMDDVDKMHSGSTKIEESINKLIESLAKIDQKLAKIQK